MGSQNPLTISRVYSTHFICEFDMGAYPFDVQTCKAIFTMKGNTGFFAKMVADELQYLGPIDLTQYYVSSWRMWEEDALSNDTIGASIQVEITLGRRLLNELLTTYLPTILICIVSFCTNYFRPFFFEAIVTVNLTSLLVLTTLFISVSNNLPKTAYVKMIDVWLIFVLCVPFVETILHTVIDWLREEDNIVVNHHGGTMTMNKKKSDTTKVEPILTPVDVAAKGDLISRNELVEIDARRRFYQNLKISNVDVMNFFERALKVGLPAIFLTFSTCYFSIGFTNRNI